MTSIKKCKYNKCQKNFTFKHPSKIYCSRVCNTKDWYENNFEYISKLKKEYKEKNKNFWKKYHSEYFQKNKEKISIQMKEYYEQNKEKIKFKNRMYTKIYHQLNKEKRNAQIEEWRLNNLELRRLYESNRRAKKLKATPKWADMEKIKNIYLNCPKGFEVDHIIPLQGKTVSGLHVENNLQYLTKSENCSKGNKVIL